MDRWKKTKTKQWWEILWFTKCQSPFLTSYLSYLSHLSHLSYLFLFTATCHMFLNFISNTCKQLVCLSFSIQTVCTCLCFCFCFALFLNFWSLYLSLVGLLSTNIINKVRKLQNSAAWFILSAIKRDRAIIILFQLLVFVTFICSVLNWWVIFSISFNGDNNSRRKKRLIWPVIVWKNELTWRLNTGNH